MKQAIETKKTAGDAPTKAEQATTERPHPTLVQLGELIAMPGGPFTKKPREGYKRGIDFYAAATLPVVVRASADQFHETHGRYPELLTPELLNDKIFASKFLRPFKIPETGNKLLTWRFVPPAAREMISPAPVVWSSRAAKLPRGNDLPPGDYYLKTNFGCDMYRRIRYPLGDEEAEALEAEFGPMLTAAYGFLSGNWWHNCFPRQLMIEKAIGSEEFTTSLNYTVAGGELVRIGAFQKIPDGHRKTNFTVDWEPYDNIEDTEPADFRMPSQATKDRMAEAARLIGANHGYVRVDFLLDDDDEPYLGELTFTPGNALTIITPEVERELGAKWDWDAMVR